ncbi:MAG: hypothetical protein WCA20_31590 [Candidatus Sulfotelmatobacter sp.]
MREAFLLPLMLCLPLTAVLLLMRHWFLACNFQLAIPRAAGSTVHGAGLLWAVCTRKAWQLEGIHDLDTEN